MRRDPAMPRVVVRLSREELGDEERLEKALEPVTRILLEGGITVYPTDTVYGVGGRIDDDSALERVARAKRRGTSPFPILAAGRREAERIAVFNKRAHLLSEAFWPGPLTLKLEPRFHPHPRLSDEEGRIAVRVPDHPVPRVLARGIGGTIVGTSANLSGAPSPSTLEEALAQIGDRVDAAVDAGPARHRMASTIVDVTVTPVRVVRVGAVSPEELEEVLGEEVTVAVGKP